MGTIEEFRKEAWAVHPELDVPGLFPPAVLFSILDRDPRPRFKDQLDRILEKSKEQMSEPDSPLTPRLMRQGQLTAAWDSVFHDTPGDRIALLYQSHGPYARGGEVPDSAATDKPAYAVMIKSNAPAGRKWLVTRATRLKDQVVSWCIPVELEPGKTSEVSLTVDNMIALESE